MRTRDKKEIRKGLKKKHSSAIPGHLKWTKFMHSDTKNREYYLSPKSNPYPVYINPNCNMAIIPFTLLFDKVHS